MATRDDHQRLATVLSGLSVPILWQDTTDDLPEKTGDRTDPAAFATLDVDYDDAELSDFGGGIFRHGRVRIGLFVEPGVGTDKVQDLSQEVEDLLATSDVDTLKFLGHVTEPLEGPQAIGESLWYGWETRAEFIAQD